MRNHATDFHRMVAKTGLILLSEVGSTVHGANLEGTDDLDLQGICIESPGVVLGHRSFEQCITRVHADGSNIPEGQRSGAGDTDRTVYSLRKWVAQAVKGSPTVLIPLFTPERKLFYVNSFGYEVRNEPELFLSKKCASAFRGYLNRQKLNAFSDAKHTNRPELVKQFGFDTKSAYHAIRLAVQGMELMMDHHITLPMTQGWTDYLKAVRRGEVPLYDVLATLGSVTSSLELAVRRTTLPDEPALDVVDIWLTGMYKTFWQQKGWL